MVEFVEKERRRSLGAAETSPIKVKTGNRRYSGRRTQFQEGKRRKSQREKKNDVRPRNLAPLQSRENQILIHEEKRAGQKRR